MNSGQYDRHYLQSSAYKHSRYDSAHHREKMRTIPEYNTTSLTLASRASLLFKSIPFSLLIIGYQVSLVHTVVESTV